MRKKRKPAKKETYSTVRTGIYFFILYKRHKHKEKNRYIKKYQCKKGLTPCRRSRLKRGIINETKVQVYNEKHFRDMVEFPLPAGECKRSPLLFVFRHLDLTGKNKNIRSPI